jgi:hypothetical protein
VEGVSQGNQQGPRLSKRLAASFYSVLRRKPGKSSLIERNAGPDEFFWDL